MVAERHLTEQLSASTRQEGTLFARRFARRADPVSASSSLGR
jgi:hypothetical protein